MLHVATFISFSESFYAVNVTVNTVQNVKGHWCVFPRYCTICTQCQWHDCFWYGVFPKKPGVCNRSVRLNCTLLVHCKDEVCTDSYVLAFFDLWTCQASVYCLLHQTQLIPVWLWYCSTLHTHLSQHIPYTVPPLSLLKAYNSCVFVRHLLHWLPWLSFYGVVYNGCDSNR